MTEFSRAVSHIDRRTNMRIILTASILAGLLATAGSAADVGVGKTNYDKSCKTCHGPDGAANPAIAKMMKVDMKDLKSPAIQAMSDDDIKKIITDGRGKMKPVTAITGPALDDVVTYIRSLKK
jgi:mono/diheme cytochrome c family protein